MEKEKKALDRLIYQNFGLWMGTGAEVNDCMIRIGIWDWPTLLLPSQHIWLSWVEWQLGLPIEGEGNMLLAGMLGVTAEKSKQ